MSLEHGPQRQKPQANAATIPLWPDAGQRLGLSRNGTYASAQRGEIAGLLRFGRIYRVAVEPFERMLMEGRQPKPAE
jgi:hypothetical protein